MNPPDRLDLPWLSNIHAVQRKRDEVLLNHYETDLDEPALLLPLIEGLVKSLRRAHKREDGLRRSRAILIKRRSFCRSCMKRKLDEAKKKAKPKTPERVGSYAICVKIIKESTEYMDGMHKIAVIDWNRYQDYAPKCRCGRTVSPSKVYWSRSQEKLARHCCEQCRENEHWRMKRARTKEAIAAAEVM